MKHIIANPHNGSPIEAHGVSLLPGYEIELKEDVAQDLKKSFEFLAYRIVAGKETPQTKAKKLKNHLEWSHITPPDTDPGPAIVVHGSKPKAAAARKPAAKKAAKGKK